MRVCIDAKRRFGKLSYVLPVRRHRGSLRHDQAASARMKAVLCKQWCEPKDLVIEDIPEPVAGAGEVVVTVKASALNFFDILRIQGKHQIKPPFPFSPTGEIAGTVDSVGPGVTAFKVGDRVFGKAPDRGAREKTIAAARLLYKMPDGLDFDRASGLSSVYGTALH